MQEKDITQCQQPADRQVLVVRQTKNPGMALILTALLGPVGMFYTTVKGGLIMLLVNLLLIPLTVGLATVITWPIQMVWAYRAAVGYNRRLTEA